MPFVKPSNKILVGGNPIVEELITEGTSCKPGLFVKKGTADHQVQLAGDGEQKAFRRFGRARTKQDIEFTVIGH
jgi:hypothetical protein